MAATPQEVSLFGTDVARLVPRLADADWIDSLHLLDSGNELQLALREPAKLYDQLATWISQDSLQIERMQSTNTDLTSLFDLLLQHHRGEAV